MNQIERWAVESLDFEIYNVPNLNVHTNIIKRIDFCADSW